VNNDLIKPYSAYKDSGQPWLGKVPGHWGIAKLKSVARLNPSKGEVTPAERIGTAVFLPMSSVGTNGTIRDDLRLPISQLWTGFTYFRRDDVIVAKITPCFENGKGACLDGLPTRIGFGSTEFHVLRAREGLSPQYLYRLTTHAVFRKLGEQAMTGSAGQQRVSDDFVANFVAPVPPPAEQAAIVRFLSALDRRVNRFVRAKRRLIELLTEQKQAIITNAVTRGLNPNIKLKPSGSDWLGDVPEHWEVRRAKYLYREVDERSFSGEEELLSVSHITGVTPRSEKNITMFKAASYVGQKLCRPGDLVINTMWAWMAALGSSTRSGIVSNAYNVYRQVQSNRIDGRYVEAILHAPQYKAEILFRSTGIRASRLRLYPERFLDMPLLLPPYVEQIAICNWAESATANVQNAIRRVEQEIALLREYRTRLVADVVTGRLDVRAAAAQLPDEVPATDKSINSEADGAIDSEEELAAVEDGNDAEA